METHLAVHRWRSEAKLLDKSHEGALQDPTQVFGRLWEHCVVALLGLLLCHHGAVIWRSCRGRRVGLKLKLLKNKKQNKTHNIYCF